MICLIRGTCWRCEYQATIGIGREDQTRLPVEWTPANCSVCGLEDRSGVLGAVWSRLETFIEWLEAGAAAGDPLRKKRVEAGEAAHHRRRLKYLNDVEAEFAAALR